MPANLPIVVLLSGRGSNMLNIAKRAGEGTLDVDIKVVFSDKRDAPGLKSAREMGIQTQSLSPKDFSDRSAYDEASAQIIEQYNPRLVVLAGYMRILSGAFVRRFLGRLINIHPSLLPKYPGLHTHRRALEANDRVHGATVHFVTEELDSGPPIIQGRVQVLSDDTEATLSARVQRAEHIIYPEAISWFAQGRLAMHAGKTLLDGSAISQAPIVDIQ